MASSNNPADVFNAFLDDIAYPSTSRLPEGTAAISKDLARVKKLVLSHAQEFPDKMGELKERFKSMRDFVSSSTATSAADTAEPPQTITVELSIGEEGGEIDEPLTPPLPPPPSAMLVTPPRENRCNSLTAEFMAIESDNIIDEMQAFHDKSTGADPVKREGDFEALFSRRVGEFKQLAEGLIDAYLDAKQNAMEDRDFH
jgi:hypothetical protein